MSVLVGPRSAVGWGAVLLAGTWGAACGTDQRPRQPGGTPGGDGQEERYDSPTGGSLSDGGAPSDGGAAPQGGVAPSACNDPSQSAERDPTMCGAPSPCGPGEFESCLVDDPERRTCRRGWIQRFDIPDDVDEYVWDTFVGSFDAGSFLVAHGWYHGDGGGHHQRVERLGVRDGARVWEKSIGKWGVITQWRVYAGQGLFLEGEDPESGPVLRWVSWLSDAKEGNGWENTLNDLLVPPGLGPILSGLSGNVHPVDAERFLFAEWDRLTMVHGENQEAAWSVEVNAAVARATPSGKIFVIAQSGADRVLQQRSAVDGALLWEAAVSFEMGSQAVVFDDDLIVRTSTKTSSVLKKYSGKDGSILWSTELPTYDWWSAGVSIHEPVDEKILVSGLLRADSSLLVLVDYLTGDVVWEEELSTSPSVKFESLDFDGQGNIVVALSLAGPSAALQISTYSLRSGALERSLDLTKLAPSAKVHLLGGDTFVELGSTAACPGENWREAGYRYVAGRHF